MGAVCGVFGFRVRVWAPCLCYLGNVRNSRNNIVYCVCVCVCVCVWFAWFVWVLYLSDVSACVLCECFCVVLVCCVSACVLCVVCCECVLARACDIFSDVWLMCGVWCDWMLWHCGWCE